MRKISLSVILITVMALFSCVDDKESLIVEQLRTAKATWLQSQADMFKAQGEAQKILAETEKMRAENEAKRDAAQQEIDKLLAQAQAAKTEAEAEKIRAEAEALKAAMEREDERFRLEMQQKQLDYELAVLRGNIEKIRLQKQLDSLQNVMNQNPVLKDLYKQYAKAIRKLDGLNGEVAAKNDKILGWENRYTQSVEGVEFNLNMMLTNAQEYLLGTQGRLDEARATGGMNHEAIAAKVKELNEQLKPVIGDIDRLASEMVNNYDEYRTLKNARNDAQNTYQEQVDIQKEAKKVLNKAKRNKENAEKLRKEAQTQLQYRFPGVPQSYESVKQTIKEGEEEVAKQTVAVEKATKALEDSSAMIVKVERKLIDANSQMGTLGQEIDELSKEIVENEKLIEKAQAKIDGGLQGKFDDAEDARKAAVIALRDAEDALELLTEGTPEYNAQLEVVNGKKNRFRQSKTGCRQSQSPS